jgi:methionyl-tRNA formyltransferase
MQKNERIKVIFMGTPDFAKPSLNTLIEEGYDVIAVVTQPDRRTGRKRVLTPTPVKEEALKHEILVLQPEKLRAPDSVAEITALQPDLIVTAAYGQILPLSILNLPKHGCINIHASLLPKYRGGAPIQYSIMNGDSVTGVTIMYMAEGLDTGDMLSRVEVPIGEQDDTGSMHDKLSEAGAALLKSILPDLLAGKLEPAVQNNSEATYAPNISREDERIRWERSSREIYNQVRGLHPWPIAFTLWDQERFKIWTCRLQVDKTPSKASLHKDSVPGTVLQSSAEGIEVKTGDGSIWLTKIQPAGKKAMEAAEFNRGSTISEGTILGGDPT